jgi:outer membrane murein-binding lipoprotein Lpp
MMKKFVITVVASLLLSGCMTEQLAKQKPIFSGHSNKTPQKYTQCLAPKWQNLNPTTKMIETETGYQLSADNSLVGAVSLAKVNESSDGGSQIDIYAQARGIGDPWGLSARECI